MTHTLKKISGVAAGNQRKIFYGLVGALALVSFFYGYFVQQTILNVVEREKVIKEARIAGSAIADMEASYIALTNNITLDFAYSLGFRDAETPEYISKRALGKLTNDAYTAF